MIFSNSILFGQTSLDLDYFKTLSLNISDLNDYMLTFNFEFHDTSSNEIGKNYIWSINRNKSNAEYFYALYINNDGSKSISFQSLMKSDYVSFKSTIKSKGLIFKEIEDVDGLLVEKFSNSNYECSIWTGVANDLTTYEMNLKKVR
tara:strand:- start:57 stop:494 length:438 start_codon:yes stop_codon:yes gene_type:complete